MSRLTGRALVVEDDRSWQQILAEILADSGLEVDLADNLEKAIIAIRAETHQIAVVDLSLVGMDHTNQDGLRVLDALRYHDPNCQAILLTGYATVELAVNALTEHGALTCLRKETFQRSEFRELVWRAILNAPSLRPGAYPSTESQQEDSSLDSRPVEKNAAAHENNLFSEAALVVEDDAGWRSILFELLADAGFRVRLCSGYGEGLGYLRREKYAIAVVDLSLAGNLSFDGRAWQADPKSRELESYRLLASTRASGIPTIVVSGVATSDEIEQAYAEQGIFGFLQKQGFNRQVFLQTVKDALAAVRTNRELGLLTDRERQVLELLAQGLTNKEIAETLVISTNTVKRHLKAIFEKLDIHTRSAATAKAIDSGVSGERTGSS